MIKILLAVICCGAALEASAGSKNSWTVTERAYGGGLTTTHIDENGDGRADQRIVTEWKTSPFPGDPPVVQCITTYYYSKGIGWTKTTTICK